MDLISSLLGRLHHQFRNQAQAKGFFNVLFLKLTKNLKLTIKCFIEVIVL